MKSLVNTLSYIWNHPMNRKRKLGSLRRFVWWQIRCRMTSNPIPYQWFDGVKILIRAGERGLTQNIYTGLQDFEDMAFILHAIRPDDLFLDIGANAGSYTILACAACGAHGVAFEPEPETFERLTLNCSLNHLNERVICKQTGLGAQQDVLRFSSDLDCMNHVLAKEETYAGRSITVPIVPLDGIDLPQAPNFLKIDVEGFETSVINGAKKVFNSPSLLAFVIELNGSGNRYGFDESKLQETIENFGFSPYRYDPFERKLEPMKPGGRGQGNTLYIRDLEAIEQRLRLAPKRTINGCTL